MIIATVTSEEGRKILLIGLSALNVERLKKGRSIKVDQKHPAGATLDQDLFIFFCETEKDAYDQLKASGYITSETHVKIDPRLL